jgi:hypothetical protein
MPILIFFLDISLLDEHILCLWGFMSFVVERVCLFPSREKINGEYENSDHV